MWKKFREATSNASISSVKNIFRSWTYDKFEGDEEINDHSNNQSNIGDLRDKENNVVLWSKTTRISNHQSSELADDSDISDEDDYGFESQRVASPVERFSRKTDIHENQLVQSPNRSYILSKATVCKDVLDTPRVKVQELVDSVAQKRYRTLDDEEYYDETPDEMPKKTDNDTNDLVFHRAEEVHNLPKESTSRFSVKGSINSFVSSSGRKISRSLSRRNESGKHVPNPKTEVVEIVESFAQRRYQQLDDSDDSLHSCQDQELKEQSGETSMDTECNVFNRAEDVHVDLKRKPSKLKGTKKVAKRTRKIVRRSWKWLRQGFAAYAQGFQFSSLFIVLQNRD